jgi:hypothetical protein
LFEYEIDSPDAFGWTLVFFGSAIGMAGALVLRRAGH